MIKYKKFRITDNATLRIKPENIIATVSSKDNSRIDLYVNGIGNPFHVFVNDDNSAKEIMDYVWERSDVDKED